MELHQMHFEVPFDVVFILSSWMDFVIVALWLWYSYSRKDYDIAFGPQNLFTAVTHC